MNEQHDKLLVEERFALLADAPHPEENGLRAEERRNKVVTNLRPLVARAKRRRRLNPIHVGGGVAVCAAAAALVLALQPNGLFGAPKSVSPISGTLLTLSVEGSEAEVTHSSGVARVSPGRQPEFDEIKRVKTQEQSTARLEVPADAPRAGLKFVAGPNSEVSIERATEDNGLELLRLSRGQIDVEVPKLARETSFVVVTPSIRAVVIGTAFTLTVAPGKKQDSCLRVREGLVRVESVESPDTKLAEVSAGHDWGCAPPVTESAETDREPGPVGKGPAAGPRPAQPPAHTRGTLAEETELLARAVRASQRQDHVAAERDLKKLLHKYPKSPLAGEARALLKRTRDARVAN